MTGDQAPTRETRSFSVHIVQTSSTLEICPKLFLRTPCGSGRTSAQWMPRPDVAGSRRGGARRP